MEFEVKIEGVGKFKGKSEMVLTSRRIVLVNSANLKKDEFRAFDLPLALMYSEKYNQPIFGANNITGMVCPL